MVPSVVYVPERGPLEVGRRAQARLMNDPTGVVRSVKRVLGPTPRRRRCGPTLHAPFRVETTGDRVTGALGAKRARRMPPRSDRIRELAETRFGGRITRR